MALDKSRLSTNEIEKFLSGKCIYVFDPDTRKPVATVVYGVDGKCLAELGEGKTDQGIWDISNDAYWTRYKKIRNGQRNEFYLVEVSPDVMQAFHVDGTQAFLQSSMKCIDL